MLKKKACGTPVGFESGDTVIRDVLFDGRSEELSLDVMGQGWTGYVQSSLVNLIGGILKLIWDTTRTKKRLYKT